MKIIFIIVTFLSLSINQAQINGTWNSSGQLIVNMSPSIGGPNDNTSLCCVPSIAQFNVNSSNTSMAVGTFNFEAGYANTNNWCFLIGINGSTIQNFTSNDTDTNKTYSNGNGYSWKNCGDGCIYGQINKSYTTNNSNYFCDFIFLNSKGNRLLAGITSLLMVFFILMH